MKRGLLILAAAAALLTLEARVPLLADPAQAPAGVFIPAQGDDQYLARDLLLFAKVENADGKIIGDIEDFVFNADNQIVGVVLGTGGFLGFGEKRVAVHLNALQIKHENGKVVVSLPQATKEVLDAVEPFKRKQPPKTLLERAAERAREFTDKSSATAEDAYEKKAKPAIEKASEAAKGAIEEVKEKTAPALEKAKDVAKGAYEGAKEALDKPAAGGEAPAAAAEQPAPATGAAPSAAPEAAKPESTPAPETPPATTP
jgi:hypothetical protein